MKEKARKGKELLANCLVRLSLFTALLIVFSGAVPVMGAEGYGPYNLSDSGLLKLTVADRSLLFTPSIAVNEEYNDNIFETPENKKGEFTTRVMPGFALKYNAPFWDWDVGYNFDYRHYARGSRDDEFNHNLTANGKLRIIDNFIFLDVSDTYSRISQDVFRNTTASSLFVNQTNQNILSLSPYFILRPSSNMTVKSGYRYVKTSYSGLSGSSGSSGVDYEEHGAFVSTSYDLNPKCSLFSNINYSHDDTAQNFSYDRFTPTIGVHYDYFDKSFISLEGGYTWVIYPNRSVSSPYWNVGLTHSFDFMTASLNSGVTYNTDPQLGASETTMVSLRLDKALRRGSIGLSGLYSEVRNDLIVVNQSQSMFEVGVNGNYELAEKATGHLSVTADKYNGNNSITTLTGISYPYRFLINAGVSYTMKDNLTLSFDYSYITNRNSIGSSANSTDINRVILGVSKTF